jgi:lysophospholipase L1-like esterase
VGPQALRYVALGDTFTFGDGVRQMDRWPNQLVRILRPELDLDLVANLSGRSIASHDVIDEQLPELSHLEPMFVTVQVGGNDACLWREGSVATYRENMATILDAVLGLVDADRVVVLTAPDFTLMPVQPGTCKGVAAEQSARVAELNDTLHEVASERDVAVVDVAPIADRVTLDPTLVATDGAHPSRKQYAGWADLVALTVRGLFDDTAPASGQAPASVPEASVGLPPAPSTDASTGPDASPVLFTSLR